MTLCPTCGQECDGTPTVLRERDRQAQVLRQLLAVLAEVFAEDERRHQRAVYGKWRNVKQVATE